MNADGMNDLLVVLSVVVASFAGATTLVVWLTPELRRYGAMARPGPEGLGRAVPRGAGLAIVVVTSLAAAGVAAMSAGLEQRLLAWLLPAVAVAAVSLWDDVRPLPAVGRLTVHLAAAVATVSLVGPVQEISLGSLGAYDLGAAAWPLSVLWLVGMTNAFNFMDGIDGIAGLTAAVAAACLAVAAAAAGMLPVAIVAAALAAGAAGFLLSNWAPARVFMGDVGSTFCGFTIAALPLVLPEPGRGPLLLVATAAMWPFVFDAGTTLLRRVVARENILETHHDHLYQRLVIAGWSHRSVAGLYGLLSAGCGGLAVLGLLVPALEATANNLAAAAMAIAAVLLLTVTQISEANVTSSVSV
jgi:UDP-N-acetylmuramyl pentapeptide phosphotransferase/UDP-N-acetylglucosamine-1-phosphate transferase